MISVKTKLLLILCLGIMTSCQQTNQNKTGSKSQDNQATDKVAPLKNENKTFDLASIIEAALNGETRTIQEVIDNGFNPNTFDENKRSPLMLAAYNGHTEIVKLLIDKGADVNSQDATNRTALMFASTGPFAPTVKLLLEAGAKPNLTDSEENWTAVMMAAAEGQLEVLKVLVEHGADLKMVDVDGESSLDFAKSKGHTEVATYIQSVLK